MSVELFKEGIKKFWVLPLILSIVLALVVPVYMLAQKSVLDESALIFEEIDKSAESVAESVDTNLAGSYKELAGATSMYSIYGMLIILILPIVLGVQLFGNSKKNKNRLEDFIKGKSLTKEIVYKTNIITGIVLSIAPILVNVVLLVIIKLFAGMGDYISVKTLINWTTLGVTASSLFFVVTALIGFITKSKPIQVLYTYGILFIPVFLVYLLEIVVTKVIYGFPGFAVGLIEFLNQVPAIKVCQTFMTQFANITIARSLDIWYAFVYIIIIAILAFIGYKLLKVKEQEKIQTIGDKIFKYIFIFIIGAFLYVALMLNYNNVLLSILITVGLFLVVYILKELITKKSLKAILNGKRYYIMSVVIIVVVLLLSSNLFGYETKVPNLEDVEYVTYTIAYPNKTGEVELRTEENINNIIEKHQKFISEKNEVKDITTDEYTKVYLQYKLKNGNSIIRSYETVLSATEPLFETQEYVEQKYSYMYNKKENIDILKIAGLYNGKTFIFEANRYEDLEMLNEIISCIQNDLTNHDIHVPATGEYLQYSEEQEGISILQIGLLDGMNQYTSYLYYLKMDEEYELVKKLQSLIDDESEFITWQE